MAFQVTEQWLKDYCKRTQQQMPIVQRNEPDTEKGGRRKYGNQPTEHDGKRFDSKHEAQVYETLRLECLAGEHVGLARQVTFYLPGGVKYVADFVTFEEKGGFTVYDAKSEATRKDKTKKKKKRQMKNCLNIEIVER